MMKLIEIGLVSGIWLAVLLLILILTAVLKEKYVKKVSDIYPKDRWFKPGGHLYEGE